MKGKFRINWPSVTFNPMDEGDMAILAFLLLVAVFMGPIAVSSLTGELHAPQHNSQITPQDHPGVSHFEP